ncbi:MAG: UbiH/UbiF/VisC/COQ6 family ubiquinone biosynthesis hydroxylase [Pseudomonadota bacterium]
MHAPAALRRRTGRGSNDVSVAHCADEAGGVAAAGGRRATGLYGLFAADAPPRLDGCGRAADNRLMDDAHTFDIVISGGGLAGGLAAIAFANAGFSCAIIDAQDPESMRDPSFDGRTTAISYANARLFKRLGLWAAFADRAQPINDILVTDGRARGRFREGAVAPFHLHFDSRTLDDETPLGWIVENAALRNAIIDAALKREDIAFFAPARRTGADLKGARAEARLEDGRVVAGAALVGADGRHSPLRAECAIKRHQWRYDQHGIVVTVAHEHDHNGVAQEFFLPSGPFAILPMTENRSSLVWTETSDAVPALLALEDRDFLAEIENRFGPYIGEISLAGPRFSYPLAFTLSQRFIANRTVLIGDAARAIHPIAGQGFNLGVKDIAALTDVFSDARRVGLDIGAANVLENYQRWRRFDSVALALGTDVLNRLFSNDFGPLRAVRSLGVGIVNRIQPASKFFMRQAGSDVGALPTLLQPDAAR